jgi:outer membrane receptor protein involved in Fe transport
MKLALALTCALFTSVTARAQIQNEPTEIVTASPLSAVSERVGSWPVYELNQEQMVQGEASIADSLNSMPGLAVRENGSPFVSIRGSSQADRVLRLLEGIPLNMADGVGANDIFVPVEILQSVTLIKGPASVFYGPAAMAGALDHRVRHFERPSIGVGTSSDNDFKTFGTSSFLAAVPIGKGENRSQVSFFEEYRPGKFAYQAKSIDDSGLRTDNSNSLTRGTFIGETKAGSVKFTSFGLLAKNKGETPGSLLFPARSTYDNNAVLASVDGTLPLSSSDQVSARITHSGIWGLYDEGTTTESTSYGGRSSLAVDGRFLLAERVVSQTFLDLTHQELAASYFGSNRYFQDDADLGEVLHVAVDPTIEVSPAARFNSRTKETLGAVSLSKAIESDRVYATFSQGYRSPSLSDLHAHYVNFDGNPNLKAERSNSFELGGSLEHGKRYSGFFDGFTARGALFYTTYSNLIDSRFNGSVLTKENVGEARAYGGEANAGYSFSVWTIGVGYGFLEARNQTLDEPLRLSPKHQGSLSISQQIGPVVIEAKETVWSSYFDRHPTTNLLTEMPGWETFDLTFRTLALTDWELSGGVVNAFNESRELTIGYPESQRRVFLSALRSF